MSKVTREVDRFPAKTDDGFETTIIVDQDFLKADTLDGNGFVPGMKTAKTIDGYFCNRKDDDTFEMVGTFRRGSNILRRVKK